MFPPEEPQIPLKNYILKLREDIKLCGLSLLLKKWHNVHFRTYKSASKQVGLSENFYRVIILGDSAMPIWSLKKFLKVDPALLEKIYKERIYFTARNKRHLLPKVVNPKLAYYIGYLHGDGHVDSNEKRVSFFDKYPGQLEIINRITKSLFGIEGKLYLNKVVPTLDIGSVGINYFLSEVLGIKRGKRHFNEIPLLIRRNKILLKWYMCGLFDAEGAMPLYPKRRKDIYIDIAMKDITLISLVKKELEKNFNIKSYGPYKRVFGNSHTNQLTTESELKIRKLSEIEKFLNTIETLHPDKIRRKSLMLKLLKKSASVAQSGIRASPS